MMALAPEAQAQTAVSPADRAQTIIESALAPLQSGPGCVAGALQGDSAPVTGAAGLASIEFEAPLSADTPLYVGSIAKQFIAAAALILEQEGDLDLDMSLTALMPELPRRFSAVTGRHLLTHSSGLRDYLQIAHHAGAGLNERLSQEDTIAVLARQSQLDFPPGAEVSYSNSNYFLLERIIERATGETIDAVARRLIFEPLVMRSSRFLSDGLEVIPGRARGYREDGDLYRLHEPAPGVSGMLTTLHDLFNWAKHINALKAENDPIFLQLTTPFSLTDGTVTHEAAGLRIDERYGRPVIEHSGSNRGFNAYIGWYPDDDLSTIVMCNVRQARAVSLAHDISAALLAAEQSSRRDYPQLDSDALDGLAKFAGVYNSVEENSALELELDAPYAIATIYGGHPSDSKTASNVLASTETPGTFELFNLEPRVRLSFENTSPRQAVLTLSETLAKRFQKTMPPTTGNLDRLVGRYRSRDLNVVYVLSKEDDALTLAIERPDGRDVERGRLTPVTKEFYIMADDPITNITLVRNRRGEVKGFKLSEPRVRNVAFERE